MKKNLSKIIVVASVAGGLIFCFFSINTYIAKAAGQQTATQTLAQCNAEGWSAIGKDTFTGTFFCAGTFTPPNKISSPCPKGQAKINGICSLPAKALASLCHAFNNGNGLKCNSTQFKNLVYKDIKELRDLAVTDDHETSVTIILRSDGTVKDYFAESTDDASGVNTGSATNQAKKDAEDDGVTIVNVVNIHNHPNPISDEIGISGTGYPPSWSDLASSVLLGSFFSGATVVCLEVDAWNVWQYSVPPDSELYTQFSTVNNMTESEQKTAFKDGDFALVNKIGLADTKRNPSNTTQQTDQYIGIVNKSGGIIRNVSSSYNNYW